MRPGRKVDRNLLKHGAAHIAGQIAHGFADVEHGSRQALPHALGGRHHVAQCLLELLESHGLGKVFELLEVADAGCQLPPQVATQRNGAHHGRAPNHVAGRFGADAQHLLRGTQLFRQVELLRFALMVLLGHHRLRLVDFGQLRPGHLELGFGRLQLGNDSAAILQRLRPLLLCGRAGLPVAERELDARNLLLRVLQLQVGTARESRYLTQPEPEPHHGETRHGRLVGHLAELAGHTVGRVMNVLERLRHALGGGRRMVVDREVQTLNLCDVLAHVGQLGFLVFSASTSRPMASLILTISERGRLRILSKSWWVYRAM